MSTPATTSACIRYGLFSGQREHAQDLGENQKPISTQTALERKHAERLAIAQDIAAFEQRKGRIEVLPGVGVKR